MMPAFLHRFYSNGGEGSLCEMAGETMTLSRKRQSLRAVYKLTWVGHCKYADNFSTVQTAAVEMFSWEYHCVSCSAYYFQLRSCSQIKCTRRLSHRDYFFAIILYSAISTLNSVVTYANVTHLPRSTFLFFPVS